MFKVCVVEKEKVCGFVCVLVFFSLVYVFYVVLVKLFRVHLDLPIPIRE